MDSDKKIKFIFNKSPNYTVFPANGAWGGITSRGDFMLDFFVEHHPIPLSVTHEVTPKGLGPETNRVLDQTSKEEETIYVIRELMGGILTSIEQAKSIADFILKSCEEFEKYREQQANKKEEE